MTPEELQNVAELIFISADDFADDEFGALMNAIDAIPGLESYCREVWDKNLSETCGSFDEIKRRREAMK